MFLKNRFFKIYLKEISLECKIGKYDKWRGAKI